MISFARKRKSRQSKGFENSIPSGSNPTQSLKIRHILNSKQADHVSSDTPVIQTKLTVSTPNDRFEQEADEMANRVMNASPGNDGRQDQRLSSNPSDSEHSTNNQISSNKSINGDIGKRLPDNVLSYMEPRFGTDFSHVRIHTNNDSVQMNQQLHSLAFTHGQNIYFAKGQTPANDKLTAHELTHVIQQADKSSNRPSANIQTMRPCPESLMDDDPTPSGWQSYHGNPTIFHCGYRGILEDRIPTPDDPQNECFYDNSGTLVDENHEFAGCRGTPNQYDSDEDPLDHTFRDSGGIWNAGAQAFITSRMHDISQAIEIISVPARIAGSIIDTLGQAIALGVLTAQATANPINWRYRDMPSRTRAHLNVIGMILSSSNLTQDVNELLANLTKPLGDFPIANLLPEIAADINTALRAIRGEDEDAPQLSASSVGELSIFYLVEQLHHEGIIEYIRPPADIAQEKLDEQSEE